MSSSLKLDWCSYEAAKYAVEKWHYSHSLKIFPNVRLGVWERDVFIGAAVFARGANRHLGRPYGLSETECAELIRVALTSHITPVSRILSIAVKMFKQKEQGVRLIVSFADTNKGHHGGIYQAAGWVYTGQVDSGALYVTTNGRELHQREVSVSGVKPYYGQPRQVPKIADCKRVPQLPKHRYLMPLDPEMRARILPLAKPYPKRAASIVSDASSDQPEEGLAKRTAALQEVS